MIVITGWRSRVAVEFLALLPSEETATRGDCVNDKLPVADRYLFCQGVLRPKQFHEQSAEEIEESYVVNYRSIRNACDEILVSNPAARVCVIGSESGYRGSYDGTYAAAKADLHRYVETRELGPGQQLVAVSPWIIGDAGMTKVRKDGANLERRREEHPKGRFLTAAEVALMAFHLLYVDRGYTTGTVIRMHGQTQ